MTPLGLTDWYLIAAALPVGSCVGTLIDRLPADDSGPVGSQAQCAQCGAALTARDLVPLASWLAAQGRCRHCGAWLGWFYPAVELAALGIALLSLAVDRGVEAWIDAGLGWWLLTIAWIDWRHRLLPDALTLPLIVLGLAVAGTLEPDNLPDPLLGAACGYFGLRFAAWGYRRVRSSDGLRLSSTRPQAARRVGRLGRAYRSAERAPGKPAGRSRAAWSRGRRRSAGRLAPPAAGRRAARSGDMAGLAVRLASPVACPVRREVDLSPVCG